MALPTTITGAFFPSPGFLGPFLSSGGNVYVVTLETGGKCAAWKATDPTVSFAEQDAANRPVQSASGPMWVIQNGDVLSIAAGAATTTPAFKFHQFNMATDTWSTTIKDETIASPTLAASAASSITIIKRSDGSFVALLSAGLETLMGVGRDRISWSKSTDGGTTWTAPAAVGATGVKRDVYGAVAVLGASNRTHFFYSDTTTNLKHRSLSSADALDTEAAVSSAGTRIQNYLPGIAYVSGANTVIKVPAQTTGPRATSVGFNSAANPTISTDVDFSANTIFDIDTNICYAVDDTTTHALFIDNATGDTFHDLQADGGGFGTDVNEFAGTINGISANIYTRSGSRVLAYLMNDGGTAKYNEILLTRRPRPRTRAERATSSMIHSVGGVPGPAALTLRQRTRVVQPA